MSTIIPSSADCLKLNTSTALRIVEFLVSNDLNNRNVQLLLKYGASLSILAVREVLKHLGIRGRTSPVVIVGDLVGPNLRDAFPNLTRSTGSHPETKSTCCENGDDSYQPRFHKFGGAAQRRDQTLARRPGQRCSVKGSNFMGRYRIAAA